MFLRKSVLKIRSKFTGDHPCRSVISIKLLIEIILRHMCSPVNLLNIFRAKPSQSEHLWMAASVFSYLEVDKTMIEGDMRPDPVTSDRQRRAVSSLARHKWPSNSIPYVFDERPGQSISKPRVIVR